jgi:uncharacterized repeat protein (TIGR04138 family)
MQDNAFSEVVAGICERDPRYEADAYYFVRDALDVTTKQIKRENKEKRRHISGQELMEGIRAFAVGEFGPMAMSVLQSWGIVKTADFGEIVFNLVAAGVLGKTDEDRKEHFTDGYDFYDAFVKPFLPASAAKTAEG